MINKYLMTILNYRNGTVIQKYISMYNVTEENANEVFGELVKFLIVCSTGNKNQLFVPSQTIDNMRHLFLEDKHYNTFCTKFLGKKINHYPTKVKLYEGYCNTLNGLTNLFGGHDSKAWVKPNVELVDIADCAGGE